MTDLPTVIVDYTPAIAQKAGIGRLVREQLSALDTIQNKQYQIELYTSAKPNTTLSHKVHKSLLSQKWQYRLWFKLNLQIPLDRYWPDVDLYHATDFVLPPLSRNTKSIVTVHDLSFELVPETSSPPLRKFLKRVVPESIRRSDRVIADSFSTKNDLISLYGIPAEKINVVWSGVNLPDHFKDQDEIDRIRKKYGLPTAPYILSVGTVQPRKNYKRLVQALAQLRQKGIQTHLAIAGSKGWLNDDFFQSIDNYGMQNYVHLLGFVDDGDLNTLYQGALCTAFISLYEGFGFPVLESMANKTPVITSNISSLPEVAGDAAILVDPNNIDEIIVAIENVISDASLRQTLVSKGLKQAKKFSWIQSAKQLHETYLQVLGL